MINRQLYTMKFNSSRLKDYKYDIQITPNEAFKNGEMIALADNQLLRTIRDVVKEKYPIDSVGRLMDRDVIEEFYKELKKVKNSKMEIEEKTEKIKEIKDNIIKMSFIPEYITIVIEHDSHYKYLYKNGLKLNGKTYYRLSTSAGQARVSTVSFCSEDVLEAVNTILDNGRNMDKKLAPSKYNAYKGLYGSATKVVTEPRFCVVDDYESEVTFEVNHVTTTGEDEDDYIERKTITKKFDRFDGQGLISPIMAKTWSKDLGLDYTPAEFCIRQSFLKGMLCVFDFHEFCKTENDGNYEIYTIYKDEHGNNKKVNLKEIDVIITASQFKLWDSFTSQEQYVENYRKNNLKWGVALHTDKELKNSLYYNYQFLQVLNVRDEDIEPLCEDFVKWITGVNVDSIWYTLLFLLGNNVTTDGIKNYFKKEGNEWIKALIVNHELINDKYIRQKIYKLIKKRITDGCMGRIIVEGNNQTLVSDPYAMMQHICGQEVTGLLGKNEYYSHYWNSKNVNEIVGTRPPLTYRSEVTKLNLTNDENKRYWYKHLYGGIIVNVHGYETDLWAGSDWDYDFLSTTNNPIIVKSVYDGELPVVYDAPKPQPILFSNEDLYNSDRFTFGSKIGQITNKSTSGIALLREIEDKYGIESREYKTLLNRIRMCTKLQSAQIDKAKIGKDVKGIPKTWVNRKYINEMDIDDSEKNFLKSIMLDRHPYFFIHLYAKTKKDYKVFMDEYNFSSIHKFGVPLKELLQKENKTLDEQKYIETYYKYLPVIDSKSVMNNICRYIESVDFGIKKHIAMSKSKDVFHLLEGETEIDGKVYAQIETKYKEYKQILSNKKSLNYNSNIGKNKYDENMSQETVSVYGSFEEIMDVMCESRDELVDYLIYLFYNKYPHDNKDLLWNTYGEVIVERLKNKAKNKVLFPMPDKNGNIEYLHDKFSLKEVTI